MILKGKTIFILGLMKFDDDIESTNYTIARHLAKDNLVYYVDNPFTWRDYMRFKNTRAFNARKGHWSWFDDGIIKTGHANLNVLITPLLASIHFIPEGWMYRMALKINEKIIARRITRTIKKNGIGDYIFINSYNFHYPDVADMLKPALKVYHCVDPLVSPYDLKHGRLSEDHVVKTADVIICSSRQLYVEKKAVNPNTYFVPNAADISHSQQALDPQLPVADVMTDFKKPVIGYFGAIERRMDFDLLKKVAALHPDKSFVFVGPQGKIYIPDWFYHTHNIYLTGPVPYRDMPAVVKGFDVALLPFKKDEVSRTIFPLKLFEYLGAGKAVISTDFNEDLEEFTGDTVAWCKNAEQFSEAITSALAEDDNRITKRLAIAAGNTWNKRAAEFSEILNNYLDLKKANSQ